MGWFLYYRNKAGDLKRYPAFSFISPEEGRARLPCPQCNIIITDRNEKDQYRFVALDEVLLRNFSECVSSYNVQLFNSFTLDNHENSVYRTTLWKKWPLFFNVKIRCLWQRGNFHIIVTKTKRKEIIPNAKRKYKSNQEIKRTFTTRTCY